MSSLQAQLPSGDDVENTAVDVGSATFQRIADGFDKLGDVTRAIKRIGLQDCGIIFGKLA